MLPFWDRESRDRINAATLWTEQWKGQLTSTAQPPQQINVPAYPQPIRGILLQNIWGGRKGQVQCLTLSPQKYSFGIAVSGLNVANPNVASPAVVTFKIKVYGLRFDDTFQELFTTGTIGLESTAEQVGTALILAAQGVSLPVGRTDVQVHLGNPFPSSPFTPYPAAGPPQNDPVDSQPEIDKATDPTETYTGAWTVGFSGTITSQFAGLVAEIVPVASHILTDVTCYPMTESLTDRIIVATDVFGRPQSYPWKVGSKVVCLYFPDIGFGIIGSNYHDMSEVPL